MNIGPSGEFPPGDDELVGLVDGFGYDVVILRSNWVDAVFADLCGQGGVFRRSVGEQVHLGKGLVVSAGGEIDEPASRAGRFDDKVLFLVDRCRIEHDHYQVPVVGLMVRVVECCREAVAVRSKCLGVSGDVQW